MNVIIAGGSGLIGQAFTADLLKHGHRVWVLTRRLSQVHLPAGAQAAGWDGASGRGWESVLEQADAVVNLAGENIGAHPWTRERKGRIRESRVQAGQAIVRAIQATGQRPRVLVQSSAVGYYGPCKEETLTEGSPAGRDFLSGVAVDWENSTRTVEELGVRRVIIRTGVVLAAEGGILSRFLYPVRLFAGGPMGSGRQWISWIHMRDQLAAMRFLMEHASAAGAFNVCAPEPVTNAEFVRTLAGVLNRPYWLPAPAFALKLVLGEMSTLVLDGQKVVPARLQELGFRFTYPELDAALENLVG